MEIYTCWKENYELGLESWGSTNELGIRLGKWQLKSNSPLAVRRKNWQILTVSRKKKLTVKNISGGNNRKVLTVSRKLAEILTDSRKSHHPIETLMK